MPFMGCAILTQCPFPPQCASPVPSNPFSPIKVSFGLVAGALYASASLLRYVAEQRLLLPEENIPSHPSRWNRSLSPNLKISLAAYFYPVFPGSNTNFTERIWLLAQSSLFLPKAYFFSIRSSQILRVVFLWLNAFFNGRYPTRKRPTLLVSPPFATAC